MLFSIVVIFFTLIGAVILISNADVMEAKWKQEKDEIEAKRKQERDEKEREERERIWRPYKTRSPWRYCWDIDRIFSSHPASQWEWSIYRYDGDGLYIYNDDRLKITRDKLYKGKHKYTVELKSSKTTVLSIFEYDTATPEVYRPQGSTGWEDHLIYISEHIDHIIRKEKEAYEAKKRREWNRNHSPLP